MDERTLECLQFPDILRRVAEACQSALGRRLVESARPGSTVDDVQARLAPVSEAMALLDRGQDLSLDGLGDPGPLWDAVGPIGHALDGDQLLLVAAFLETTRRAETFLRQVRAAAPAMARLGDGLTSNAPLETDLRKALNPDGTVADHASDALRRARSQIRTAEARIRDHVDALIGELSEKGYLQDAYATTRDGRFVFPVKSSAKNRLQGIIHGSSNTGETVFVEPAALVTMSNDLEELRQAEARESLRVRIALTDRVRPFLGQLRGDTERLAALDSAWGRARAARRFGWNIPHVQDRVALRIVDGHHPVLHMADKTKSIGAKLSLNADDRVIVITGPNAGGKTTFMKTLGLAVLLTQCGIPAPLSPDSRLPVFNQVWADIGDAQDVASGQSTFSAHARRLAMILTRARERSLVLLDELGTATDPSEGAALAEASLDILRRRGGLTFATSHLTPLKQWAHETPGARNASFALDEHSRRPTFTLLLDIPGTSEALVIAEREGVPPEVLDLAKRKLQRGEVELGELLRTLGNRERTLADAESDLRRRLEALAHQEELARRRAETFREERRRFREDAAKERERQMGALREEVEKRIATLPAREAELQQQRVELTKARRETQELQREAERERRLAEQSLPPLLTREELQPGRVVFVIDLREQGELLATDADGRKAQVALGRGLVVEVPVDGLARSLEELPSPVPYRGTNAPPINFADDDFASEAGGGGKKQKTSKKIKRQEKDAKETTTPTSLFGSTWGGQSRDLGWKLGGGARRPAASGRAASASQGMRSFGPRKDSASFSNSPQGSDSGSQSNAAPGSPSAASGSASPIPREPGITGLSSIRYSRKSSVPWQIDLHGMRVEEAIEMVDKYLDDAVVADMPFVKLCHGQGTGRLGKALRDFLAAHAHVRAWRFGQPEEGGGGVTIVELR